MSIESSNFLPKKYPDLPGSKPVRRTIEKAKRENEQLAHTNEEKVVAYLDRLESMVQDPRSFSLLKYKVLERYTTKEEDIPESYWKLQEKIMRERGQIGDWEQASDQERAEVKRQNSEGVLADQRSSLEQWLDYLASSDSQYIPRDLKYWVFRSVLKLGEFDKEKKEFPERSKGTLKQFPDINYEALGYVVDAMDKKYKGKEIEFEYDIQSDERASFTRFLEKEDFAKLYAWANELMNPVPEHLLPVTEGEWRTFPQGDNHQSLVASIRGKGTGWCTAGENTAHKQLEVGDFYVFYSLDDDQNPTIPRIAIRMEGDKIAEVRGIAYKQNLDPYMGEVLAEKLQAFPDGAQYLQKEADMKRLSGIEEKTKTGKTLTKEELSFLYELDTSIEGFGYQKDPRIAELRGARNVDEDILVIFDCTIEQIAHTASDITEQTRAYVGQLEPGIFQKLPENFEHIYTTFPDKKIRRRVVEIGGQSGEQLLQEMKARGINVSDTAKSMITSRDFTVSQNKENITLVRLTVSALGFSSSATTDQIYKRAEDLGLELCPAEVGPHYRIHYQNQPLGEWFCIAMKQIRDQDGNPKLFFVEYDDDYDDGLWLDSDWAGPDDWWDQRSVFVFSFRKKP